MYVQKQTRYVVVLGSLLSGIGKGIVTSSIAKLLSFYGYNAMPMKFDGYLNYDCGTMNPLRHGEVFVLDDKSEVDMDFGNYERFLNKDLNGSFSLTGGKVFSAIITKERRGDFLGEDVQIVPHLTNMITDKIRGIAEKEKLDVLVIEVGGTVGDIENSYFIESMRQLALNNKTVFVDVTYIPELNVVGEQKTKPTQIALRSLMLLGIQPDFIVARSEHELGAKARRKIALFSNLPESRIIDDHDVDNIYSTPKRLMSQKFDAQLLDALGLNGHKIDPNAVSRWNDYVTSITDQNAKQVNVSVVGKYVNLKDSYASVKEAIVHAAAANGVRANIDWIESEELESDNADITRRLADSDGILVPGGFGDRGIEGMVNAIKYARENRVPYLGLCLGMQLMAVEFARDKCGIKDATSSEFDPKAEHRIIHIMEAQKDVSQKGGTMRLGSWEARIKEGTRAYDAYGSNAAHERHRHRYEFNNDYRETVEKEGMTISATTTDGKLVEMIEWKDSFGIGTQAHPELKSRPERPAPLFVAFMKNAKAHSAHDASSK